MIKKNVAVALLFNPKREILLQKKSSDYHWFPKKWCLFGGKIEKNEKPEKALERELKEEFSYSYYRNRKFLGVENYHDKIGKKSREGKQYIFYVPYLDQISNISLREGAGFAFFSYDELDSINIVSHDLEVIKKYYSKLFKK